MLVCYITSHLSLCLDKRILRVIILQDGERRLAPKQGSQRASRFSNGMFHVIQLHSHSASINKVLESKFWKAEFNNAHINTGLALRQEVSIP